MGSERMARRRETSVTDAILARQALKDHFGYDAFRPGQQGVVEAILAGRDALAVMPTGAGKSVCYQVPGIVMEGLGAGGESARVADGRSGARAP